MKPGAETLVNNEQTSSQELRHSRQKEHDRGAEAEAEAFRTRSRDIPQKQALLKPGAETFLKSDDLEARNGPVWRG